MRVSRIKLAALVPFALFVAIIASGVALVEHQRFEDENSRISSQIATAITASFDASVESEFSTLRAVAETLMTNDQVKEALRRKDRARLLDLSRSLFGWLSRTGHASHLYFSDARRVNVLRAHMPERHSDVIDRPSTLAAARTLQAAQGIEIGVMGNLTLRVVVPCFDKGELLGFVETGVEISHLFDDLRRRFDIHPVIALPKKGLKRADWEQGMTMLGRMPEWDAFADVVLAERPDVPEPVIRSFLAGGIDSLDSGERRFAWAPVTFPNQPEGIAVGIVMDMTSSGEDVETFASVVTVLAVLASIAAIGVFWLGAGRVEATLLKNRALLLRQEERLRESEARFRSLVEGTTDWIWETDENHKFTWFSPGVEAVIGVTPEIMIGRRRWDLASEAHEIDPGLWAAHIADMAAHRSFRDFRYWIQCPDGQARWISTSGTPLFDEGGAFKGYRGSGSDVTPEAAQSLRLRTLSAVVGQAPVSVVVTDPKGLITYVNAHFTTATGYEPDEVLGKNSRLLSSGETPPEIYRDLWETIISGRTWKGEIRNRRKSGALYWEHMVVSPITDDEGCVVAFASIKEDITYRKEAEAKLAHQMRVTRHHYDNLRALNDIASLPGLDVDRLFAKVLALGCEHLGMPLGIISHVQGERYVVTHHHAPKTVPLADGQEFDLGQTYCAITLETGDVVAIPFMGQSIHAGHPCYKAFGLEAYIGAPLFVHGVSFGTVNFSSPDRYIREFDEADLEFMRLLARWVGAVLERAQAEGQMREALAQAEAAHQRTDLLLNSAGEGIFGIDSSGVIIFSNPSARRILRIGDDEVLAGRALHAVTRHTKDDGRPCSDSECAVLLTLADGIARSVDSDYYQRADGSLFPVEFSVTAMHDGGAMSGAVLIFRDIGERVAARNALTAAHARTEQQAEELARTNAELEQFAYVASHDLRQPLRMVSSYLSLIQKRLGDDVSAEVKTFFGFAIDGARRMDRLILDLLEYSRAGRGGDSFEPLSLAEIVDESLLNLQAALKEADAEISLAPGLPAIMGHRSEMVRLFQNLIGNAVKYRAPDRRPVVAIGWKAENKELVVWVKDNGIGIAPEHHERVFGIFQRLVTRDAYEGTGIGLAVCKKIVENHGGRIWIESAEGRGSCFFLAFPVLESSS